MVGFLDLNSEERIWTCLCYMFPVSSNGVIIDDLIGNMLSMRERLAFGEWSAGGLLMVEEKV